MSDPVVLQFDHVIGQKRMAISTMLSSGLAIATIRNEIKKCEVRCANCHLRKTARERDY